MKSIRRLVKHTEYEFSSTGRYKPSPFICSQEENRKTTSGLAYDPIYGMSRSILASERFSLGFVDPLDQCSLGSTCLNQRQIRASLCDRLLCEWEFDEEHAPFRIVILNPNIATVLLNECLD